MTFCIGIVVDEGVIALADTRIVRGSETASKTKLSTIEHDGHSVFVMTSGLRSVRDKAVHRLADVLDQSTCRRMHELATAYGEQLREVRAEDGDSLTEAGLTFNSHAVIGGRLADDEQPSLFHVYPEGNWVEVVSDEPYVVIGRTSQSKALLDMLITRESSLQVALTAAFLAFDATRTSVSDVDFPIDVIALTAGEHDATVERFDRDDMSSTSEAWSQLLRSAAASLPTAWITQVLTQHPSETRTPS